MSNKVNMEIRGLEKLQRSIEELGRRGSKIENQALQRGAEIILNDAILNAPVATGKGWKGLSIGRPRKKGDKKTVLVGIDKGDISEIYYMKFHEFGTSKMTATPFLSPAYEKNKKDVQSIMISEIKKGLGLK